MRAIVPFLASALFALPFVPVLATPASAAPQHAAAKNDAKPGGPKELGKFEDWIAATYQEGGQPVCYAFTRAGNSTPKLPGRGEVILSVTERPTGRDAVALSAGFAFAANAEVTVQVDQTALNFYTAQRSAFARDGKAAVAAFQKGAQAVARSPGPRNVQVVDTFSLKGFSAAYAAVVKACPAK